MLTIQMTRTRKSGNAVFGKMVLPFSARPIYDREEKDLTIDTLENALYIIPAGTYPLRRTYSYKFKKLLPLVDEVPDRSGIRIHRGTLPEHSKGCILLDMNGMAYINVLFNQIDVYGLKDETVQLTVTRA
jgi:hypothetical protein